MYLYVNYNRSFGTRCKARAANIEILAVELEPGDNLRNLLKFSLVFTLFF